MSATYRPVRWNRNKFLYDAVLLADKEGGPLPDAMFDLVGLTIEIEGEIERRGDLLVFKVDLDSARKL